MSSFRIRPRFKHLSSLSSQEVHDALLQQIKSQNLPYSTMMVMDNITVKLPEHMQQLWSPQLSMSMEKTDEGTIIRGLYGPNPSVWAVFFFGYVLLGLISVFVGMYGFSLAMLGQPAPLLWVIPGCGAVAAILYFLAQTGQKLGAEQMYRLHLFYESALHDTVPVD